MLYNIRELTQKCPIGDKMHNWAFQIEDWGLGNRLELVGIDCNRLEKAGIDYNMQEWAGIGLYQPFPAISRLFLSI